MPPRTRKETPEAILFVDESKPMLSPDPNPLPPHLAAPGKFVNIVVNGQTRYKNSEVIDRSNEGLTLRTDLRSISLAEVTFVPWSAIEGVGIVGAR